MRFLIVALFALLFHSALSDRASAAVEARVQISMQRMVVYVDGSAVRAWTVSTGRRGFATPTGSYRAQATARMHYSRKYHNSPMPHSVFFTGGYAVHGTNEIARLGRPASHGCVRLHPAAAAELYALVREHGLDKSRIVITR